MDHITRAASSLALAGLLGLAACSHLPGPFGSGGRSSPTDARSDASPSPTGVAATPRRAASDDADDGPFNWPGEKVGGSLAGRSPWQRGVIVANAIKFAPSGKVAVGAWWLDVTPGPVSATQHLAFVEACVANAGELERMMAWAICAPDADALDRKAFEGELSELDAAGKRGALRRFDAIAAKAATRGAEAKALAAADPGIAKLLGELPTKARAEWAAAVKRRGTAVADAIAVFDAGRGDSKRALEGCDARLWPHVVGWVRSLAREDEDLDLLLSMGKDPVGNVLTLGLHACYGADTASAVNRGPWAGERMAVLQALWNTALEFDGKDRTDRLRIARNWLRWEKWPVPLFPSSRRSRLQGVIERVADDGAMRTVTFRSTKVRYKQCAAERDGKLEKIRDDGTLVFERVCTRYEWATATSAPDPVTLPARFAAGLAPGRYLDAVAYEKGALPIVVRKSDDPESPVVARAGVTL